jgi:hypothetical protein
MSFKTFAAIAGAAAILCGCATMPSVPPSSAFVAPYADSIALSGRLNVRYLKDDKQESTTVNFDWKQDAQNTDVALFNAAGGHAEPGRQQAAADGAQRRRFERPCAGLGVAGGRAARLAARPCHRCRWQAVVGKPCQ